MFKEKEEIIATEFLPMNIENGTIYRIEQSTPNSYTHSFFKYPCKFIPEIPRWAIRKYMSRDNDGAIIFDPFAGSGTTLLEGIINGYDSYGTEIDSVAKLIIKVKTTPFSNEDLEKINKEFIRIENNQNVEVSEADFPQINNLYHWFSEETVETLAKIKMNFKKIENDEIRDFFKLIFAAIIKKVSFADDSSPKPYVSTKIIKNPPEAFQEFKSTYKNYFKKLQEFSELNIINKAQLVDGDALNFSLKENADLAITSPPYINAFDYGRTLRLENLWLDKLTENQLREKKKNYVGTERISIETEMTDLSVLEESSILKESFYSIRESDPKRALIVKNFFDDMKINLELVHENLNDKGKYIIVIGDSTIRKIKVKSSEIITEIAVNNGYKLMNYFSYTIQNPYIRIPRKGKGGKISKDNIIVLERI